LQIFFFFLALPQLGIILPGLWAGVIALGLNYGAYMSEIFRAGLSSVGKGQREAAIALGMTPGQTMQRVVLPQALRFAIPPTGNEFLAMTKDSALVSATGFVHELMWRSTKVGRAQFHNLEALIMAAMFTGDDLALVIFSRIEASFQRRSLNVPVVKINLDKYFGCLHVLKDIALRLCARSNMPHRAQRLKSTLLRCINFLKNPRMEEVDDIM
jgi:ABC-type arginine transport system permease subunit